MTQGERVKEIRKSFGLTLDKFGEHLGLRKSTLSAIETGRNTLTEQNIKSICREFNINENWLRNGTGKMFIEIPEEDEYFKAATLISKENDIDAMDAVIKYWKLDAESKKAIWDFIHSLAKK